MSDPKLGIGTNHCKCSVCGEYFTTEANFAAHRQGKPQNRRCIDPGTLVTKKGIVRYRINAKGLWAGADNRPNKTLEQMNGWLHP